MEHPKLTPLAIAEICHEVNRTFCKYAGDVPAPAWAACPDDLQQSCLVGVMTIMRAPDTTCEQSHAAWMAERTKQGWEYGPVLDRDHKVHPNLVPYDALSLAQRFKDMLFRTVILAAMSAAGSQS